jgi:hypothetical protein
MSMYWGMHAARLEICFLFGQDWPLTSGYHNIIHLQNGIPNKVSETWHGMYYPETGLCVGNRQSGKAPQNLGTLFGRGTMLLMPAMVASFCWGIKRESWSIQSRDEWSLWVRLVFWHECPRIHNRHRPIGTLLKHCWAGKEKKWRGCKKSQMPVIMFRTWGASLENTCANGQALIMNYVCTHIWRTLQLISEMPCTEVEQKSTKHGTVLIRGKIWYVAFISLYHYVCTYGMFPACHPKMCEVAECLPACLNWERIIKCKVLLIGTCIMQFFRTKANPNWYFHCFVHVPTRLPKTTLYILKRSHVQVEHWWWMRSVKP